MPIALANICFARNNGHRADIAYSVFYEYAAWFSAKD
jgi:hypothetical protein